MSYFMLKNILQKFLRYFIAYIAQKRQPFFSERLPLFCQVQKRGLRFSLGRYGNDAAVAVATLESNNAVNECEERVILAHAYVLAGIVNRAALANDNVAGCAGLATPNLNT